MASELDLITSAQAAAVLGKSSRTVHRLVDAGALKPAKQLTGDNGAYLFHRADVERIAQEKALNNLPVAS